MRRFLAAIFACAAFAALAQTPPPLQPLPEGADEELEPQVTVIKEGEQTVEEYRINGRLYMMKITPARGAPYYLIDSRGDGQFTRQDSFDSGVRPPMWVIRRF